MREQGTPRHRRHKRTDSERVVLIAGIVTIMGLVLIGLRLVAESPLSATAAGRSADSVAGGDAPATSTRGKSALGRKTSPSPTLAPLLVQPASVSVDADHFWSWALLDQRTNKIFGSENMAETSTTASMIKSWIAADFLRRNDEQNQTPSDARLHEVSIMIRDSDNDAATDLYDVVGQEASTRRAIDTCGLTDSAPGPTSWSDTTLSARDTVRLADCIDDGRAAGDQWTSWLLTEMKSVRGVGDFGIRKAFPASVAETIAIKNGWVVREDGNWHLSCLAIGDNWTMGVMMRYPASLGFTYGANLCRDIAGQLRT
jgi:hypothetical protein